MLPDVDGEELLLIWLGHLSIEGVYNSQRAVFVLHEPSVTASDEG